MTGNRCPTRSEQRHVTCACVHVFRIRGCLPPCRPVSCKFFNRNRYITYIIANSAESRARARSYEMSWSLKLAASVCLVVVVATIVVACATALRLSTHNLGPTLKPHVASDLSQSKATESSRPCQARLPCRQLHE